MIFKLIGVYTEASLKIVAECDREFDPYFIRGDVVTIDLANYPDTFKKWDKLNNPLAFLSISIGKKFSFEKKEIAEFDIGLSAIEDDIWTFKILRGYQ